MLLRKGVSQQSLMQLGFLLRGLTLLPLAISMIANRSSGSFLQLHWSHLFVDHEDQLSSLGGQVASGGEGGIAVPNQGQLGGWSKLLVLESHVGVESEGTKQSSCCNPH